MSLPLEVWINGRTYLIEDCGTHPIGDVVLGCLKYQDAIILINMDCDLEGQLKTLWHEMTHAFQQDLEGKMDEDLACLVSLFVHNILCHNREIADFYCTHNEEEYEFDDEPGEDEGSD